MQLINGTAAINVPFQVSNAPASLFAGNLAGAEKIEVFVWNGTAYAQLIDWASGAEVELTLAKPHYVLPGPGTYQLRKGVTAGAVTVVGVSG